MSSIVSAPTLTAGTAPAAATLNLLRDAIQQLQGNSPTGGQGPLDFFRGHQVTTQTLTSGVWASVTLDVEDWDLANGHTGTSSQYVVQQTGYHRLAGVVGMAANTAGHRAGRFALSGTAVADTECDIQAIQTGATPSKVAVASDLVYATAGQYFEIQAYQNSGGNLATSGGHLTVQWVHV